MNLKDFLDEQIKKGNTSWKSKSELIRLSGNIVNGHTTRIIKEYEKKFNFGSETEIKNKEIKKYFSKQEKNSFISVEGTAREIQKNLPKEIIIGETIIYSRLKDPKFNINNLKPQTLHQESVTAKYDVKISQDLKEKLKNLREPGVYLYIEMTQRGGNTLRLKTNGEMFKTTDSSYPPNLDSLKLIKKKIEDNRK